MSRAKPASTDVVETAAVLVAWLSPTTQPRTPATTSRATAQIATSETISPRRGGAAVGPASTSTTSCSVPVVMSGFRFEQRVTEGARVRDEGRLRAADVGL